MLNQEVLAYPDGDSLLLFNPYHDERGRFTTKQGAVNVSGLPGAADADLTTKKKGEHFAVFLGDECEIVEHLDPKVYKEKDREMLATGIALAQHGLNKVGLYRPKEWIQRVHLYDNFKEFAAEWGRDKIPRAWNAENQTHMGPNAVFDVWRDMLAVERKTVPVGWKYPELETRWRLPGIGTAAHELYHAWMRDRIPTYQGWVEEGLASAAQSMVQTGLLTGDFHMRTDEGRTAFHKFINRPGLYRPFKHAIRNAAQVIAREHGGENWHRLLDRWVRHGYDPNNIEDILSVPLPEWLVEDIWESIGKMEWVPDDTVLLFNPYHDERGRFTSKERATFIGQISNVKKVSEKETEDGIEALFSGDHYTGSITVPGSLNKEDIEELHNSVAVAMDSMKAVGIKGIGQHIKFYDDVDKYAIGIKETSTPRMDLPTGLVDEHNIAHIHPAETKIIRDYAKRVSTRSDAVETIGTIIHELYHGRREGGGWSGRDFPRWIEEGLASFAEDIAKVGIYTKDFQLKTRDAIAFLRDYMEYRRDIGIYAREVEMIRSAAAEKAGTRGTVWTNILEWVQRGDKDTGRDIEKWFKIFQESFRHELSEDTILLFNPYHDERGRFTSKERATTISGIMENAGVKDVKYNSDRDGNSTALFSGAWNGIVKVDRGKFTTIPEEYWEGTLSEFERVVWDDYLADMRNRDKHVLDNIGIASNALADLGIKTTHRTITAHDGHNTFLARWSEAGGNFLNQPSAFVTALGDAVHLGPWITHGLMWKKGKEAIEYIGIVAHELFHIREWRSGAIGRELEEGLASIAEVLVNMKLGAPSGGYKFTPERFNRFIDKLEIGVDTGVYDKWAKHISNAASKMEGDYYSNLRRLLNTANPRAEKEILDIMGDWPKETWEELQDVENTTILLFNPYHDVKGRFTDRQHAKGQLSENKLHLHGEIDQRTAFRAADATQLAAEKMGADPQDLHIYDSMDDFIKDSCAKASDKNECVTRASNSYASYVNGAIRVSPLGTAAIDKDRAFGERIISHESWHSRKRKGGKLGPVFSNKAGSQYSNWAKRDLEEATTDLLSVRSVGGKAMYPSQMGAVAMMIGAITGWNREKAWKEIDNLHFNINNDKFIDQLLTDFTGGTPSGGWTPEIKYALLAELMQASGDNNHAALAWLLGG